MKVFSSLLVLLFSWLLVSLSSASSLKELTAQIPQLQGEKTCRKDSDCRYAGVGHRPCGGPRYYLIYSLRDAQEKKLIKLLGQIEELEKKQQQQGGIMGACMVAPKPQVTCMKNHCQEKPKKEPDFH